MPTEKAINSVASMNRAKTIQLISEDAKFTLAQAESRSTHNARRVTKESLNREYIALKKRFEASQKWHIDWLVALDLGWALKKIFNQSNDYWLAERYVRHDEYCHRLSKETQQDLLKIHSKISHMNEDRAGNYGVNSSDTDSMQYRTQLSSILYWIWQVCDRYASIPYILGVVMAWLCLPSILTIAPYLSTLVIFLNFSSRIPDDYFGHVVSYTAKNLLQMALLTLLTVKTYMVFFFDVSSKLTWENIKKAVSPRSIDWSRFFRGFLYTILPMVMAHSWIFGLISMSTMDFIYWSMAAILTAAFLLIQTLQEEIMFRRPAAEARQNTATVFFNVFVSAIFFGIVHIPNPEFSVIGSLWYGKAAMLSSYVIDGFFWSLATLLTGGVELTWGMHFANNLFLCVLVGYTPSPITSIPLIAIDRGVGSPTSNFYSGIKSVSQVLGVWTNRFISQSLSWTQIYLVEAITSRTAYHLPAAFTNEELSSSAINRVTGTKHKQVSSREVPSGDTIISKAYSVSQLFFKANIVDPVMSLA